MADCFNPLRCCRVYDRYIAPLTKTKKDDEILERILELLPDAIEERLFVEKEEKGKKSAK